MVFGVAEHEYNVQKDLGCTWGRYALVEPSSTSLKCVRICYIGVFGVAEHEYNAQDDLQRTWGALRPGGDVVYRVLTQLPLKCVQISYSGAYGVAEHEYNGQDYLSWT